MRDKSEEDVWQWWLCRVEDDLEEKVVILWSILCRMLLNWWWSWGWKKEEAWTTKYGCLGFGASSSTTYHLPLTWLFLFDDCSGRHATSDWLLAKAVRFQSCSEDDLFVKICYCYGDTQAFHDSIQIQILSSDRCMYMSPPPTWYQTTFWCSNIYLRIFYRCIYISICIDNYIENLLSGLSTVIFDMVVLRIMISWLNEHGWRRPSSTDRSMYDYDWYQYSQPSVLTLLLLCSLVSSRFIIFLFSSLSAQQLEKERKMEHARLVWSIY